MRGIGLRHYEQVRGATDSGALQASLLKFVELMDFERLSAVLVDERPGRARRADVMGNIPPEYEAISNSANLSLRDPVVQRLKVDPRPFAYDQSTYVASGTMDLWDIQAGFGYATGISVAMHTRTGFHFYLGLDRTRRLPAADTACARLFADLHLLAAHAQDAACRVFEPVYEGNSPSVRLTPRERQCLYWAHQGKSTWETACILGISESTTSKHLNSAIRRLNCVNKTQAVAVALRLQAL
jgi:DNA-binding CsgD family transcriptional regulator